MPDGRPFSVLVVAFIAEFYRRFRDQFLGYGAETDGRVARLLRDEFSLSLECDDERAEKNADGASPFEEGVRASQGKGYVAGKGIGRSTTRGALRLAALRMYGVR